MALPKKKSRIISVDNVIYRWLVSPAIGFNILVAEKEDAEGQKIEVHYESDIDKHAAGFPVYWIDESNAENLNWKFITPKGAESIIRQALQLGWDPAKKGKPLVFDLIGDQITQRINQL